MARDLCRDVLPQAEQTLASGSLWARLRQSPLAQSLTRRNG